MSRLHSRLVLTGLGLFVATTTLVTRPMNAAVTEPNGSVVPDLAPTSVTNYSETTLQTYFDNAGETIDAIAAANKEPGKFSPLCNFEAALVLSVSGAAAGIAWYNVSETEPTKVPTPAELHHILLPSKDATATIKAADIKADPAFVGPYIGFALTKDNDNDITTNPTAIYYSEYQRNSLCTDCTTPNHWVAALAYRATSRSDTYYLAFEDWEGANASASSWQNDGDFNDKVFKLVGISCAGGGLQCDTGGVGLCGVGVSECALDGGAPTCTPLYTARDEVCDAIDNDCNGQIDDGELCPTSQVCIKGSCVFKCGGGEFLCPDNYDCGTNGYCIESACVNVTCDEGLACRDGTCTSPCSGVVCPLNQTCVDGLCKDICTGKVCGTGSVCDPATGACIGTCGCTACADGKVCDLESGRCVDSGCEDRVCDLGQSCVKGACVDACANAVCPGRATCTNGSCAPPIVSNHGGSTSGTGGNITVGPTIGSTPSSAGNAGSENSGNGAGNGALPGNDTGCGCRLAQGPSKMVFALLGFVGLLFAVSRKRRRY